MAYGNGKFSVCLIALATLALKAQSAEGRLITWEFAGVINTVSDPDNELAGVIVPGSPFSVSFTYESTTPDRFPKAEGNGSYDGAIKAVSGQVGGISFSNPVGVVGSFSILDDVPPKRFDTLGIDIDIVSAASPVEFFNMHLSGADLSGAVFADDSLPVFPPDLDMLDSTSFILQTLGPTVWVRGELTSITPEPTSLLLFALTGVLACRPKDRQAVGPIRAPATQMIETNLQVIR